MTTAADILKRIKDENIKYVDLRFTDMRGKLQHVTFDQTMINEDIFEEGTMFDGSSIAGWKAINESDMVLMPDPDSAFGRVVQCEVLKIDEARRNIVVSRRSLIERQREEDREALLKELEVGQMRKGVVKNIADFGAFVDLGGIDGLLHITDMSWERIGHPSEMVAIDQEIEVMVLHIDREKKKIALGLKQKGNNPWDQVIEKYPVGSTHKGSVVNVMSYGAFVKLEPGIEGLVHISEMSWTRRVNHPSELVNIGDEISVVILGVDKEGQQLSLGMKQTQENPWTRVAEKYPVDAIVTGKVRNLTNYGAFVELEEGIDGLLHVSDMSWTRKISHPNEMLEKGQEVRCKILSVDQERRRIALGMKQLDDDPWNTNIPGQVSAGPGRHRHGHEDHQLWRLRRPGRRPGRPAAHLGARRPQGRESRRRGESRRQDRGEGPPRRYRRAEDRPVAETRRMERRDNTRPNRRWKRLLAVQPTKQKKPRRSSRAASAAPAR